MKKILKVCIQFVVFNVLFYVLIMFVASLATFSIVYKFNVEFLGGAIAPIIIVWIIWVVGCFIFATEEN